MISSNLGLGTTCTPILVHTCTCTCTHPGIKSRCGRKGETGSTDLQVRLSTPRDERRGGPEPEPEPEPER